MSVLEIILSSALTLLGGTNFVQFLAIKELKNKQKAEVKELEVKNMGSNDRVLFDRIDFLNRNIEGMELRLEKLEKIACFNTDCKVRV